MKKTLKEEESIIGKWIISKIGSLIKDDNCKRIEWLISNKLIKIASSLESGDWEILYKDPDDGRLWEETYLESERHGGGPPSLLLISEANAHKKYNF